MTSHDFDTKCHAKMDVLPSFIHSVTQVPPAPYLRDVIYEWSPRNTIVQYFTKFVISCLLHLPSIVNRQVSFIET